MESAYVNIHTHHPTGCGIELRIAGVHPWYADKEEAAAILPQLAQAQAIGEIGLDFACRATRERQLDLFRAQLALACERGLPVVLHCVKAFTEVMRELAACEPRATIFHGFIGSSEQARQALEKGYYLSFGERTFASPKTIEALRATSLDRLFLETDDSEISIEQIYARIAELTGTSVAALQQATTENYERIFHNG